MELNDFITNFVNQFDEPLTITVTKDTNFRDEIGEWDSLTAMTIIAMIIDEYGITLKSEEFKNCITINDIFELIKSKK
jgi:acyl carrier protein